MSYEEVNPWGAMEIPEGRKLATRDPRDAGGIHVLPQASDDAIQAASRRWPRREADEFERVSHSAGSRNDVLRVRNSKSEDGIRSIAISPKLAEALWQHRRATSFQGDDERVFCHSTRGTIYDAEKFRDARGAEARGDQRLRSPVPRPAPYEHHERRRRWRESHRADDERRALQPRDHDEYLHVAGVVFRDEAARLEARLPGDPEPESDLASVAA